MRGKSASPAIVWFRQDLRLADNHALRAARAGGRAIVPVFIWSPEEEGGWPPGSASRWWLHHSLQALDADLRARDGRLILLRGPAPEALLGLARKSGADALYWNRRYEPAAIRQEDAVLRIFKAEPVGCQGEDSAKGARTASCDQSGRLLPCRGMNGILLQSFNASLLNEPWDVVNKSGMPFRVFTPYWKSCLSRGEPSPPLPEPRALKLPARIPSGLRLVDLGLLPRTDWAAGLAAEWTPGRKGALRLLHRFLSEAMPEYSRGRDRPDTPGTSRLSPHLHHGEIGVREVWAAARSHAALRGRTGDVAGSEEFLREIGWREFAHHLLFHFPKTPEQPLREQFRGFSWRKDSKAVRAWHHGKTGFPFVDAGMRELWGIGWMHNRVRMVAASFLVKDLLIPWQEGARWFWDTLVDADLANNTLGWQWVAGCGADAAPYFRIFNPVHQGERFDPAGRYVRQWVPELSTIPEKWVQRPFDAPEEILSSAGIRIGKNYPTSLVDHGAARLRALAALAKISKRRRE